MRLSIFAALSVLLLGLGSCCSDDPFEPTLPPTNVDTTRAYLRVIVASYDIDPVEVYADDSLLIPEPIGYFDYPESVYQAEFLPVDTSTGTIEFRDASGSAVASTEVSLAANNFYTVYLYGEPGDFRTFVTSDEPTGLPGSTEVRYRLVNLVPDVPPITVRFDDATAAPAVTNLAYGDTSAILTESAGINKSLYVFNSQTDSLIVSLPSLILPGRAVVTIVLSGFLRPGGEEPFLYFNIFTDSRRSDVGLYGSLPLKPRLSALRFLNAVPTGGDCLDLSLQDPNYGQAYPDQYRRNFPGQDAVLCVRPLGSGLAAADKGYFFLSNFLTSNYPYRVEIQSLPPWQTNARQEVLATGPTQFVIEPDRRYTVIAYGPYQAGQVNLALMRDRMPQPPPGLAQVRFFHGAYNQSSTPLKIRIGTTAGPLMQYGEAPDPIAHSFAISGTTSAAIEVIDDQNRVIHRETGVAIDAGGVYTIVLSRGPDGSSYVVTAVSDQVIR